jgi:hypothetical protein
MSYISVSERAFKGIFPNLDFDQVRDRDTEERLVFLIYRPPRLL